MIGECRPLWDKRERGNWWYMAAAVAVNLFPSPATVWLFGDLEAWQLSSVNVAKLMGVLHDDFLLQKIGNGHSSAKVIK